jgi:hypothetical protein
MRVLRRSSCLDGDYELQLLGDEKGEQRLHRQQDDRRAAR